MKPYYRYVIETLLFLTYAAFGVSWIAVTPLVGDLQAEFGINSAQLGLLNTLVAVAKVVAPILTGLLAIRIGLKKAILLGSLCICFAALAPFSPNFGWFLASRFMFGIGGAMVVTLLGPMTMQWFNAKERPLINAFNNVAVNTGITITLFATVPLASLLGWRHTLLVYGLISVALCVAWAVLGREHAAETGGNAAATATNKANVTYGDVWRMPETWIIALGFAGPLALYLAFNTWLPRHYMEAFGMTKAAASQFTGLFNLVGIPTAIAAGLLTQKLGVRRPFIIGAGFLMVASAFGMILFRHPALIMLSAVGLGIALFAYVAPLFTIPMELPGATPQHVSLMMGTVFSIAYVFSSLSPVVAGFLRDLTGSFLPGLGTWAFFSLALAAAGMLLPETGPGAKREAAKTEGGTGSLNPANATT
ncbi:MAG: MFS transporter [Candidatus Sericytochromatia bacterium]|nr:MFS transporter [Candidatus Tanganyikabacteria bacterium]